MSFWYVVLFQTHLMLGHVTNGNDRTHSTSLRQESQAAWVVVEACMTNK